MIFEESRQEEFAADPFEEMLLTAAPAGIGEEDVVVEVLLEGEEEESIVVNPAVGPF